MPLKLGLTTIAAIKYGGDPIAAAYLGDQKVFSSGAPGPTPSVGLSVTSTFVTTNNLTSTPEADIPLGDPDPNRLIIVAMTFGRGSGNREITSLTIGGVSASLVVRSHEGASVSTAEIWAAEVPTGETGDLSVTFATGNAQSHGVAIYRSVLHDAVTATDTDGTDTTGGSVSVTRANPGFVIAVSAANSDSVDTSIEGIESQTTNHSATAFHRASHGWEATQAGGAIGITTPAAHKLAAATWSVTI